MFPPAYKPRSSMLTPFGEEHGGWFGCVAIILSASILVTGVEFIFGAYAYTRGLSINNTLCVFVPMTIIVVIFNIGVVCWYIRNRWLPVVFVTVALIAYILTFHTNLIEFTLDKFIGL